MRGVIYVASLKGGQTEVALVTWEEVLGIVHSSMNSKRVHIITELEGGPCHLGGRPRHRPVQCRTHR